MNHIYILALTFLSVLLSNPLFSQSAGSGSFSNFSIDCSDGGANPDCFNSSPTTADFLYTVPGDGDLVITGMTPDGSISCCGTFHNYSVGGGIFPPGSVNAYGYFNDVPTSFTFDCVEAGTQFEIRFWGNVGTYSYNTSFSLALANDVEPNNSVVDAIYMGEDSTHFGHIGFGSDGVDYYELVMPKDGDLTVTTNFDYDGSTYLYNYTMSAFFDFEAVTGGGQSVLNLNCVSQGDIFYLLILDNGDCSNYTSSYNVLAPLISGDPEPNDSKLDAISLAENAIETGHIGYGVYSNDGVDYYEIVAPADGTLMISSTFTNGGTLTLYNYTLSSYYDTQTTSILGTINMDLECVSQGDTFYLLVTTNGNTCSEYHLSYDLQVPILSSDMEPNDSKNLALVLPYIGQVHGHVGYGSYSSDGVDYYEIVAPHDGTLTANVNFTSGGKIYLYNQGITTYFDYDEVLGPGDLSVSLDCVGAGDQYYVLIFDNNTCSEYALDYNIINPITLSDVEPNNTIANAISITEQFPKEGRIGYSNYSSDNYDWYVVSASKDGTFTAEVNFASDGIIGIYNETASAYYDFQSQTGGGTLFASVECVAAGDLFHILIAENGQCSTYNLNCETIQTAALNDVEPNDSKAAAQVLPLPLTPFNGQIGHGKYNVDYADFLELGTYYMTDSILFNVTVSDGPVSFYLFRQGSSSAICNLGTLNSESQSLACYLSITDIYYLHISSSSCSSYEIEFIPYCPLYSNFSNLFLDGEFKAQNSISANSTVVNTLVKFDAPCVELNNGFEVPLGQELEVDINGCTP